MMWKEEYKSRFKPSGRIGRKDCFKNAVFILVCSAFLMFVLLPSLMLTNKALWGVGFAYGIILAYVWLCLLAKRMHDIGLRLWWAWLIMIINQLVCGQIFPPTNSMYVAQGINLLLLVLLFLKKGQEQANKFGDVV